MKLAYWMYAGPAHIGTLRVASSFKNVHAIMHAPLGDDYFNVMRSMLERERDFTPVTASIVDRHVLARGSQEKVVENITRKNKEESPDLVLLTPTCTSSILQEDLHNFVERSTIALTSTSNFESASALDEGLSKTTGAQETAAVNNPDVILADVNHYRVNELQAADRTLEQIVRFYLEKAKKQKKLNNTKTIKPSVNIIGIFSLGFHNQHDCRELKRLFNDLGITVNEIIPEGGCVHNLKNLPKAWFNFVPYREIGLMTAVYLKSEFNMPYVSTTPMGLVDTSLCIREIAAILEDYLSIATPTLVPLNDINSLMPSADKSPLAITSTTSSTDKLMKKDVESLAAMRQATEKAKLLKNSRDFVKHTSAVESDKLEATLSKSASNVGSGQTGLDTTILAKYIKYIDEQTRFVSQAAWFARSIDCQNLTGKKAVVFGDATHAAAMTKILSREMGIRVSCAGTYCKHDADWFREQVAGFCDQILITDDHTQVGDMIAVLEPAAIFGTQMERHVGKRLDIPCGVISAPVHIQNFPLGYRPFLGYEGANQIADLVYNSFSLGMEEHLLEIFGGHDITRTSTEVSSQASMPTVALSATAESQGHQRDLKEGANEGLSLNSKNIKALPSKSTFFGTVASLVTQHFVQPLWGKGEQDMSLSSETAKKSQLNTLTLADNVQVAWSPDGLAELGKVPGFVRGKVKRNTEKYAEQNQIKLITVEIMYAAKEAMTVT